MFRLLSSPTRSLINESKKRLLFDGLKLSHYINNLKKRIPPKITQKTWMVLKTPVLRSWKAPTWMTQRKWNCPENSCTQILESPHLDDLRCGEQYTKRSEERKSSTKLSQEGMTSGVASDIWRDPKKIFNKLSQEGRLWWKRWSHRSGECSLINTRESLSANAPLLEQFGQLLDKALAK